MTPTPRSSSATPHSTHTVLRTDHHPERQFLAMTPQETGSTPRSTFDRRTFMRGSLAAAALLPLGGALASCASSGSGTSPGGGAAATTAAGSAKNPFGLAD